MMDNEGSGLMNQFVRHYPIMLGTDVMVSSGHSQATLAGIQILKQGGNAIDAGVAMGLCINVMQPDLTNLGGVAPIMIYLSREDKVYTISGLGVWPKAASIQLLQERGGEITEELLTFIRFISGNDSDRYEALTKNGIMAFTFATVFRQNLLYRKNPKYNTSFKVPSLSIRSWHSKTEEKALWTAHHVLKAMGKRDKDLIEFHGYNDTRTPMLFFSVDFSLFSYHVTGWLLWSFVRPIVII